MRRSNESQRAISRLKLKQTETFFHFHEARTYRPFRSHQHHGRDCPCLRPGTSSKEIDRLDQRQAQEYRDDLEPKFGQIEILLLGKGRDVTAAEQNDPPRLQVYSYEALISTARTQLDWFLAELKTEEP